MIRPTLTLCLHILIFPAALFASADLSGRWTNGYQEYTAAMSNDSTWNFNGADLHEGGYRFLLKSINDSSFLEIYPDGDVAAARKKPGRKVVYRVIEGQRLLIFHSKTGTIESIYTIMEPGKKLEDIICGMKTAYELAGDYLNLSTGKEVIFYPTRPEVGGLLSESDEEQRRIMRNEIYARHGYIFKSADLQSYFAAQPWYKPVDGAGEAQLTELETLNARIIADHPGSQHH